MLEIANINMGNNVCKTCNRKIEKIYGKKKYCTECQKIKQRRKKRIKDNLKKGIILNDPDKKERKCIGCGNVFTYKTYPSPRCEVCKATRRKRWIKVYLQSEKVQKYMKTYNKTRRKEVEKIYHQTPIYRQHIRERRWRRKQYLKNIIHNFTYDNWLDLLNKTNGICLGYKRLPHHVGFNINGEPNLTLDHIYPINLAYKDFLRTGIKRIYTIKDVQPLCSICNGTKNAKVEDRLESIKETKKKEGELNVESD